MVTGEHAELLRRERILEMALKIQNGRVMEANNAASREIALAARPEYQKILRRLAEALVEAGRIADEEAAFRAELERGASTISALDALPFRDMQLDIEGSKINQWFDEARELHGIQVKAARQSGTPGARGIFTFDGRSI